MRIRWWQSISWRLTLGSTLVALLATGLLALTALLAIIQYYSVDQKDRLDAAAVSNAQSLSDAYVAQHGNLRRATLVDGMRNSQTSEYIYLVFDSSNALVYPFSTIVAERTPLVKQLLFALAHPNYHNATTDVLRNAITLAQANITEPGEIGPSRPVARPFIAVPITNGANGGSAVGVLFMIPKTAATNTVPPFISAVGKAVLLAALVVALIAALAAILFARTITRPLSRLTSAARKMATGDYTVHVPTDGQGEIGVLTTSFNEMAAQLNRDVEELRKQELWRRELIMSVTHDLATPLTAIAGLGESLVDGVNRSREDYEATGRIIVRETLRLRRLVKDLHIMAKVEAGALSPTRAPVRLAALVDNVFAVLAPEFERAHVEPNNAVPYNLPPIPLDADMLTRVFTNLCNNALRHTPEGGMVTITAIPQGEMLCVSVADTGEGIPPDALTRVFERFFRADSARRSSTGGSGLGLAIVKAMIEAHGGRVWAENVPTGGARISFTLPLHPTDSQQIANAKTMPLS
jgi:signal transduction histidine kinase